MKRLNPDHLLIIVLIVCALIGAGIGEHYRDKPTADDICHAWQESGADGDAALLDWVRACDPEADLRDYYL